MRAVRRHFSLRQASSACRKEFVRRKLRKKRRKGEMGSLIILGMVGIPCALTLIWFLTPSGKRWLKENHMI